jgi:hypothetical protein
MFFKFFASQSNIFVGLEAYFKVGCKSLGALDGKFVIDLLVLLSVTPKNGYLFCERGEYLWKKLIRFTIKKWIARMNLWSFPSKGDISAQCKQACKRFLNCDCCEEGYSSALTETSNDNPFRRNIVFSFLDGNELINPIDSPIQPFFVLRAIWNVK